MTIATDTLDFPHGHGQMDILTMENLDFRHGYSQIFDQLTKIVLTFWP